MVQEGPGRGMQGRPPTSRKYKSLHLFCIDHGCVTFSKLESDPAMGLPSPDKGQSFESAPKQMEEICGIKGRRTLWVRQDSLWFAQNISVKIFDKQ